MQKWNAFPVSTWVLDLFENAGIATMVGMYPAQPAALAWITMLLGSLKWFSLVGTVVLLLTGVFMAIKNRFAKN